MNLNLGIICWWRVIFTGKNGAGNIRSDKFGRWMADMDLLIEDEYQIAWMLVDAKLRSYAFSISSSTCLMFLQAVCKGKIF